MREPLLSPIQAHRARRPRSRVEIVRERLIAGVRQLRALLKAGMALARGGGLDLCPRLKALKDRHLLLPRRSEVPAILSSICHVHLNPVKIEAQRHRMVHLFASVHSGHTSAIIALTRFGSAARGDPLDEALVQLEQLLKTLFRADYLVNEAFRRELLRVLVGTNLGDRWFFLYEFEKNERVNIDDRELTALQNLANSPLKLDVRQLALEQDSGNLAEICRETAKPHTHRGSRDRSRARTARVRATNRPCEFDALCLPTVHELSPKQIRGLRTRTHMSQAVLAALLNTSTSTVQKWEISAQRPSGPSLKLLDILWRKGVEALA
jgi:DNA-binding transcriptional regulator YiaG